MGGEGNMVRLLLYMYFTHTHSICSPPMSMYVTSNLSHSCVQHFLQVT